MGKNKHKKNNPEGITSSVGGTFTPRKKEKGLRGDDSCQRGCAQGNP